MRRVVSLILLLAALALPAAAQAGQAAPPPADKPPDGDSYFQQLLPKFQAATTPAEKLALCQDFLAKFPAHRYSLYILENALESCLELNQPAGFFPLADSVLGAAATPAARRGAQVVMAKAYAKTGELDKVRALVGEISGAGATFDNYQNLFPILAEVRMWPEIALCVSKAAPLANAEAIQKEYPNRQFTPADLERRARGREGVLLLSGGWAKANTGARTDALADFQAADAKITRNFMGVCLEPLDLFWGRTLLMDGRADAAIDRLARQVLFGGEPEHRAVLQEAYLMRGGDAAGFEAFVESLRPKFARPMTDFTLPGYDGKEVGFAAHTKDKVVLLTFWFPT
jgi:hypothetical protein